MSTQLATAARTSILGGMVVFVTACAGGPPPEPPAPAVIDRSGEYSVTIDAAGQSIDGTLLISGEPGAYMGSIDTAMGGAQLSTVEVDGDVMTFSVAEVGVSVTVVFDGDSFSGDLSGSMGSGTIIGLKTGG